MDATMLLTWILLGFLIVCAIASTICKNIVTTILIFMSYSLIMAVVWILLESPDLAGTEAAVGAGVTTILFFITYKRMRAFDKEKKQADDDEEKDKMKGKKDERTEE